MLAFALPAGAGEHPPQILEIYRDRLKPANDAEFRKAEEDAARICVELKCPHPYLTIESLTGSKEVWYLNGFESEPDKQKVGEAYEKNVPLMQALNQIVKRKQGIIFEPINVFANYRADLSRGETWRMGHARFLVITMTKGEPRAEGAVYEAPDGTRFIVRPARTRHEASIKSAAAGEGTRVFAVRPYWGMPAQGWVAADPEFWRVNPVVTAK